MTSSSGTVSEAVARAEAELASFWAAATDEQGTTKARASTMNFVAVAAAQDAAVLRAEIEQLAETRAGRVFLLTLDGRLAPWEVAPDVSAVCHKEGDVVVCYDRVEIAFGAMAAGRAASVVGALSLPEVPTILEISAGAPAALVDPLVTAASRIVLDSTRTPLARVAEIARRTRAPIGDRAFVRTFSWRELVARFFDEGPEAARAIRRVEIERTTSEKYDPAALLVGWLASRLGWKLKGRDAAVDLGGEHVAIVTRSYEGTDLGPGELAAVRISTSLEGAPLDLAIAREGGRRVVRWRKSGARCAEHEHPLGYHDEGWVLLKAIDATEGDEVYREAALAAADWSAR